MAFPATVHSGVPDHIVAVDRAKRPNSMAIVTSSGPDSPETVHQAARHQLSHPEIPGIEDGMIAQNRHQHIASREYIIGIVVKIAIGSVVS
jgi:hypothetical protein